MAIIIVPTYILYIRTVVNAAPQVFIDSTGDVLLDATGEEITN